MIKLLDDVLAGRFLGANNDLHSSELVCIVHARIKHCLHPETYPLKNHPKA